MNRSPLHLLLDPPNCFFTVLRTADRTACFGVFFFYATSSNSGMLCDKNSLPIDLTAGRKNFLANGKATRPTPAARNHFHVVLQALRNGVVVPVGRSIVPFIEISEI